MPDNQQPNRHLYLTYEELTPQERTDYTAKNMALVFTLGTTAGTGTLGYSTLSMLADAAQPSQDTQTAVMPYMVGGFCVLTFAAAIASAHLFKKYRQAAQTFAAHNITVLGTPPNHKPQQRRRDFSPPGVH